MVYLRRVDEGDKSLLFYWRNLPEIVALSLSQKEVSWQDHKNWFNRIYSNPAIGVYEPAFIICDRERNPLGHLRFDKDAGFGNEYRFVSIYFVDNKNRGRGYGEEALSLSLKILSWDYPFFPDIKYICAKVMDNSGVSVNFFKKMGFKYIKRYTNGALLFTLDLEKYFEEIK